MVSKRWTPLFLLHTLQERERTMVDLNFPYAEQIYYGPSGSMTPHEAWDLLNRRTQGFQSDGAHLAETRMTLIAFAGYWHRWITTHRWDKQRRP